VINAFERLTAADTQHILDVMSQAGNRTALTFEKMATILPIVSAPANAIGVDFERLVALMGVLSNAGIHVATSATSLKNIFIDTKKAGGKGYIAFLENVIKHVDKLTFANKKVGKRSVVSALALAMKMDPNDKNSFMRLTDEFKALELGLTQKIALQRLDTFRGSMKLLNAAYSEFILSIEDGNGALAQSLIRMTRVATAMLLLSSDSDQAREALEKMDIDIIHSAEKWLGWLKVIGYVTAAIIALKVALIVWRAVVMAATIVQTAWSIAMGIAAANGWLNVMALRGNAVALGTLRTVTWLATAAQTAFNAAVKVNPIYLITIGILGLAEAYGRLTGKIESSVEAHKRFAAERNREYIENKISPGDKLLSMFGFKDLITGREGDYLPGTPEFERQNKVDSIAKINPKAAYDTKLMDSLVNQVFKGKIEMNINDPNNNVKDVKSDSSWLQPKVSSTNGWSN
jgi:hypothetical protein